MAYTLVSNGKDAINSIKERHELNAAAYKLIVMDLFLPNMNGLEVSKEIMRFAE